MDEPRVNLVVVAHPDDEILGFGAAGAMFAARGEIVQPVILCGAADARTRRPTDEQLLEDMAKANACVGFRPPITGGFPNIRMNNVDHLDLVQFVETQVAAFQPHRIFTHHPADLNDDHKQICRATLAAARLFQRRADIRRVEMIALLEVPSSTDWGFGVGETGGFAPNLFVEVGDHLDRKLEALACYRNVMRDYPHSRSVEALRGLAAMRGAQAGVDRAEAFQILFSTVSLA